MRRRTEIALVTALYALIAVIVTWPLATRAAVDLAGWPYSDAYETAHHMWWIRFALESGESPFFAYNLAYPDGIDGITLWSNPLHFFPGWALTIIMPLPLAYNVQLLATLALNGLSAYLLLRWLLMRAPQTATLTDLRRGWAVFGGGLVFMLYPTMQAHLGAGHAGLMVQWPVPLAAWALLRLREQASGRSVLLAGLCCALVAGGHPLQPIYALVPLAGVVIIAFLVQHQRGAALRAMAAAATGLTLVLLYLLPTFGAIFGNTVYADEGGNVRYSADLLAPVTPSFLHPVFGQWDFTHRVLGVNLDEGAAYLGAAALLLAVIALWKVRPSRLWLALGALAFLLSLGPLLKVFDQPVSFIAEGRVSFVSLPGLLMAELPGLRVARTPGRFSFLLALSMAMLAGYGAAWLMHRWRRAGPAALALLLTFIVFEYQTFWPLPTTSGQIPEAITALADRNDFRAVLDVPWGNLETAKAGLYLQTGHEHALMAGQITRSTTADPARLNLLEAHMDPALLRDAGADIVIVHRGQDVDGALLARATENLGPAVYSDDRFAVFETPQVDANPRSDWLASAGRSEATAWLFVSRPLWIRFEAQVRGEGQAQFRIDQQPANPVDVQGETEFFADVALAPGFHTLALRADPTCPANLPFTLTCALTFGAPSIRLRDDALLTHVEFAAPGGVDGPPVLSLDAAYVPIRARAGEMLEVPLLWSLDAPITLNDIRFVHVVDRDGQLIAQQDIPLGDLPAGLIVSDTAVILLPPDLAPGSFRVFTGWYRFPEIASFCRLEDDTCRGSDVEIGITVRQR